MGNSRDRERFVGIDDAELLLMMQTGSRTEKEDAVREFEARISPIIWRLMKTYRPNGLFGQALTDWADTKKREIIGTLLQQQFDGRVKRIVDRLTKADRAKGLAGKELADKLNKKKREVSDVLLRRLDNPKRKGKPIHLTRSYLWERIRGLMLDELQGPEQVKGGQRVLSLDALATTGDGIANQDGDSTGTLGEMVASSEDASWHALEYRLTAEEIKKAIERIPNAKQRQSLELQLLAGLDYDAIAQRIGVERDYARKLVSLGRKALRKELERTELTR